MAAPGSRIVHLELHTGDLARARALYAELCGWSGERVRSAHGSYLALDLGAGLGGGIVQCATAHPIWLPYVQVNDIRAVTGQAAALGAAVLLGPREGPAGWRSVIRTGAGGELAFWQPKR